MDPRNNDVITRNSIFVWLALGTALILLVPWIAMQFTNEVSWDAKDFMAMGFLLLITGSLFVLVSRRASRKRRAVIGLMFAAGFFYVWAELAVGLFTNLGG